MLESYFIGFYWLVLLAQLIHLWLMYKTNRTSSESDISSKDLPGISVVICFKNEADNLKKNLPQILNQKVDFPVQWVFVNDGSTDQSVEVINQIVNVQDYRVIEIAPKEKVGIGKKYALKKGVAACKYDRVLLTDADCHPASDHWIDQMNHGLNNHPIVLGASPLLVENGFWKHYFSFESWWIKFNYFMMAKLGMAYMGVGRNLAYHKSIFEQYFRFEDHAHIPSGDDDIIINNAVKNGVDIGVANHSESYVFSQSPLGFKAYWKQKTRHLQAGVKYNRWVLYVLGFIQFIYAVELLIILGAPFMHNLMFKVLVLFLIKELIVFITFRQLVKFDSQKKALGLSTIYRVLSVVIQIFLTLRILTSSNKHGSTTWK